MSDDVLSGNGEWTVNTDDCELDKENLTLAAIYEQAMKIDRQIGREAIEKFIRMEVQSLIDSGALPTPSGGFRIEWED